MNVVDLFGFIASITSFIGLLPQIYKTYKTKSAQDISVIMLYNYLICSVAWIVYGAYTDSQFVLCSNIVGLMSSITSVIQKRCYDVS